jgi:hypothetical protein
MSRHPLRGATPSGCQPQGSLETKETTMKIISIIAIALSLLGTADLAMAQSVRDQGVVTGSQANSAEHTYGGYAPDHGR